MLRSLQCRSRRRFGPDRPRTILLSPAPLVVESPGRALEPTPIQVETHSAWYWQQPAAAQAVVAVHPARSVQPVGGGGGGGGKLGKLGDAEGGFPAVCVKAFGAQIR